MTKSNIKKLYYPLILVNHKLRLIAKEFIDQKPKIETAKDGVAAYMMSKAYKTHGVILNLARNGYAQDADMLARTLFDAHLIIASVVEDETDKTAMQYLRFDDETRADMFSQLEREGKFKEYFEQRKLSPKEGDEPIEKIQERAHNWLEEYGKDFKRQWYGDKKTSEMAKLTEVGHYHSTAYKLQSQLIHSLPRAMNFYLADVDGKLIMTPEPDERYVDIPLAASFNMFFLIVEKYAKHFKIEADAKFEPLVTEYTEAVKSTSD